MKRLTYRDANGEAWYSDAGTERDRLHRLAAYEDTGLLPEEIRKAFDADALRKLVQRDTAQMCKVKIIHRGMDVTGEYSIDCNLVCPSCGVVVGDAESDELNGPFCHQCGQRLAFPREEGEGEAALEGMS